MLHVIERIVTLLAAEAGEITAESALKKLEELFTKNNKDNLNTSFHNNAIYSITNNAGDYTIEFSKLVNTTHFTMNLTIYAGHSPTEYVVKKQKPEEGFMFIKTENDLVSYMANAQ